MSRNLLFCVIYSLNLNDNFPGRPGLAGTRMSPFWILLKQDAGGGDNWSYKNVQSCSQIVTINKPTSSFVQAGCPSCRPTNSVKALKGNFSVMYCNMILSM